MTWFEITTRIKDSTFVLECGPYDPRGFDGMLRLAVGMHAVTYAATIERLYYSDPRHSARQPGQIGN